MNGDVLNRDLIPNFFRMLRYVFLFAFGLSGCATVDHITTGMADRPILSIPMQISVRPCTDRTGTEVADLGAQATEIFQKELNTKREFSVVPNGRYVLNCEVTNFMPGNAIKRWIMPGWGATVGKVSAMVEDSETKEILVILEGNATVGSGGLYSVGAWSYIVPAAVKDIIGQLQEWVAGADNGTD